MIWAKILLLPKNENTRQAYLVDSIPWAYDRNACDPLEETIQSRQGNTCHDDLQYSGKMLFGPDRAYHNEHNKKIGAVKYHETEAQGRVR